MERWSPTIHFSHAPTDVQLLRDLSKIASASLAPLITGADPNLLGMDSWRELMNPRDIGKLMDTPDYAAWKGLRDAVDSRYVALCMPRVLSRLPYGAKSEPVEEFAFEEETDGHKGEKYGWMNAAYAMATNINRAFKEYGWTVRIRGVELGGEVINLPTHTFPTDDGGVDLKCPTEIAITDRREAELSKAGLISIIHRKNTDKAAFIGAQSVYKPQALRQAEATAADKLSARIPYMFAVSRFAHYLKCMVRDKIGSTKEKGPAREMAQRVDHALCRRRSRRTPARRSRRASRSRRPRSPSSRTKENPGYYSANFYLRPHFQLEGMDIGMSLVATLPERKVDLRGGEMNLDSLSVIGKGRLRILKPGGARSCSSEFTKKEDLKWHSADFFLKIDGVDGKSDDDKHKGEIQISSVQLRRQQLRKRRLGLGFRREQIQRAGHAFHQVGRQVLAQPFSRLLQRHAFRQRDRYGPQGRRRRSA